MRKRLEDRTSIQKRLFSILCLVVVVLYFVVRAFVATNSYSSESESGSLSNKQAQFHLGEPVPKLHTRGSILGLHLGLFKNVKNIEVPEISALQDVPVLGSYTQVSPHFFLLLLTLSLWTAHGTPST